MIALALVGFVGGLITGISPCILPVLPVIFLSGGAQSARPAETTRETTRSSARAPLTLQERRLAAVGRGTSVQEGEPGPDGAALPAESSATTHTDRYASQPVRGARPYLVIAGLVISFSVFTLAGTVVLSLLHLPQGAIRWAGLVILVLLGVGMIFPAIERILEKPFSRIPQRAVGTDRGGLILGLALGAVYVPCAGPVLAAITVAGATGRIGTQTIVLTIAFAVGTAIPLLFFALAGRRVAERVRAFRNRQRTIRVIGGGVMIALAVALTFNATDAIQAAIPDYTSALQNAFENPSTLNGSSTTGNQSAELAACQNAPSTSLQDCGKAPAFTGIQQWLNTPGDKPVTLASLRGKVVLVDFWAYSCINCQRAIAHVTAWEKAYAADGLEIIGVHTPEYAFEHVPANVQAGAARLGIHYPVALDNDYDTWDAYNNDSWPADYLIDATGQIRHVAIGEGDYSITENLIRQLLKKANANVALPASTKVADLTPADPYQTPETYLGSARAQDYVSGGLSNGTTSYTFPGSLPSNAFALSGTWTETQQHLTAEQNARIELDYTASDVYLDTGGTGTITATVNGKTSTYHVSGPPDIYTLVKMPAPQHAKLTVSLSPGLQAYSFTFG